MSKTVILSGEIAGINGDSVTIFARIVIHDLPALRQFGQKMAAEATVWMLGDKFSATACPRSGGVELKGDVMEVGIDHLTLRVVFPVAEHLRNQIDEEQAGRFVITDGRLVEVAPLTVVPLQVQSLRENIPIAMNLGDGKVIT